MNFTSMVFVIGFPVALAVHWLCPVRLRWIWLLLVSVAFYAVGSPEAVGLLALITVGTYLAALGIAHTERSWLRRVYMVLAVILCLGCLAWFKYAGFLAEIASFLAGSGTGSVAAAAVLLPAGISFYTFQSLSYVFDVAHGTTPVERNLGRYTLFVCYFPQLVAGPIERSGDLLPQLRNEHRVADGNGWMILLRGFAEKLLVANMAAVYVDQVYAAPQEASGVSVLFATVLFAVQIYYDFAGYSDIAIGASALLGVRLRQNFHHPYEAASLHAFWRRWHMSLTQWFTDYVYIPLGGSRHGLARQCVNIMIVFLLSGLWHGAAWHYVAWGAIHGLLLVGETCIGQCYLRKKGLEPAPPTWLAHMGTLLLVLLSWVFFRAPSVADAITMLRHLGSSWSLAAVMTAISMMGLRNLILILLGMVVCRILPEHLPQKRSEFLALFWIVIAVACSWGVSLASDTANAFIYFQF